LCAYLVARLVDDCLPGKALQATARAERSTAARGWLGTVALPAAVRAALTRLAEATGGDPSEVGTPLTKMIEAIDGYLDVASRSELTRLERAVAKS
jgi:hypothetical protein